MDPADVARIVQGMALQSPDGDAMTYESHRLMEPERKKVLATAFPEISETSTVAAVLARDDAGATRELVAHLDGSEGPRLLTSTCQITFEDLSPSECVEYAFPEAPETWTLALLSRESLESYRGMKFGAWRKMLQEPTCEAQFRRMLQIGLVARMFDPIVFPTPESLKSLYQVTDEKSGKLIQLPHPVAALRVWDAQRNAYEEIDPRLGGAPAAADEQKWWVDFIAELNAQHGEEYVASMMGR
eukprot:TRINITY_DN47095_c0_g1_i1.p1 TRINITY_DN47095_c0_g1~~TRINITY_DN47095_c0_g1_i1.p1  ORF type:complete len:271 (+),score=60.85 TRINITY_DN47095_c0_g1_i1:86-814(+)